MDQFIINKIEKQLNQRRFQAQLELNKKIENFYLKYPDISAFENEKRLIASDFSLSKEEKIKKLSVINDKIKSSLLKNKANFPQITHYCPICKDYGYIENNSKKERCSCFTKMLIDEAMKSESTVKFSTFDDFNEHIFDDEIKNEIVNIRDYLKKYSELFPNVKKPNTVLYGNTGTGKTFLLSCLYSELKKKGVGVFFLTAGKLFDILKKYAFNQIGDIDVLLDAEMLIIDDMGTEPMFNNITIEYIFMLINERSRNNKPICISTNLSPNDLKSHYTERIASRLLDKSTTYILSIPGNDLRLRF